MIYLSCFKGLFATTRKEDSQEKNICEERRREPDLQRGNYF